MPVSETRGWNVVRLLLGLAQMGGAVFSVTLMVITGIGRASLIAVVTTCALTTASVLLFGSRKNSVMAIASVQHAHKHGLPALMENALELTAAALPHEDSPDSDMKFRARPKQRKAE